MEIYEPFCHRRVASIAASWVEGGLRTVRIAIGPIVVMGEYDIFNSIIRVHARERGQVVTGSLRWYDSKYVVCRCIYGFLRLQGITNTEWEIPHEFADFDMYLFHALIRPYKPYLRVKYPTTTGQPLIVQNLWSNSYMKVTPIFRATRPKPVYPSGETSAWVDSVLNQDPSFNNDVEQPVVDADGELNT